jgi:outer membrane protein TolC
LLLVSAVALAGGVARAQTPAAPLTLGAAVAQALASDPSTLAASQQLAQVQAQLGQAQAGRRLQITFDSTAGGSNANVIQPPPSQESFYTLQNTLSVPLPIGAKPGLAVRQAEDQLLAAQAQYDGARATLAAQVGAAYFDLLRKQALLRIAQQTLEQARRQQAEAQQRSAAGDVPQLDVIRAQVPVAESQAGLISAGNDVAVAAETLNGLIGQPLDAPVAVADVPPAAAAAPLPTLEQARAQALARAPDVRAAEFTVLADQAALASARRYGDPSLSLQAIDIRNDDQTSFSRVDTVQAALTVPLSDGGLGRAEVRAAQAALAQAQAQVEAARRAALVAVSAACLNAQSTRDLVAAAQTARDIAQVAADKTALGYRNGLFSLTDVLNAQVALTQAQIAYTQAVYEAAAAANTLDAALNGGLVTDLAPPPAPPVAPDAPAAGGGTGPAGTGGPTNTPSGDSTTGPNPGGAGAAGRGGP